MKRSPRSSPQPARGLASSVPARAGGSVRVIGGRWKRTRVPVLDVPGLRPTPDRVRETLFNWLPHDLSGWRVLDAFAGTGALGWEAASRGAAAVVMVERERAVAAALGQLQQRLGATQVRIVQADALAWMRAQPSGCFELVMLDPPFGAGLFEVALPLAGRLLGPGGCLYLEADRFLAAAEADAAGLAVERQDRAGSVHFHLLASRARGAAPASA